jgi:hypothetical protein
MEDKLAEIPYPADKPMRVIRSIDRVEMSKVEIEVQIVPHQRELQAVIAAAVMVTGAVAVTVIVRIAEAEGVRIELGAVICHRVEVAIAIGVRWGVDHAVLTAGRVHAVVAVGAPPV